MYIDERKVNDILAEVKILERVLRKRKLSAFTVHSIEKTIDILFKEYNDIKMIYYEKGELL